MNRNSLMEMSGRVMHSIMRCTINQANDSPMMQELHLDGMVSEFREAVERVQHFGFTSTLLPRDDQQSGSGGSGIAGAVSGALSSGLANLKGPAAEGICLLVGGQRNHPVCIAVDDRRHRPMGLNPGENAQYDDLGQMTLLRRTGLYLLSSDDIQPQQQQSTKTGSARDTSGGSSSSSQPVARMASLRHVAKPRQPRPGDSQQSSGSSSGGTGSSTRDSTQSGQSPQQPYQHEGQTVNTEVRVSKNKIEFYSGTTVVGTYDKTADSWTLNNSSGKFKVIIEGDRVTCQYQDNSHSLRVDQSHVHMKFGGNAIWVDGSGCWSSQPIQVKADSCS